MSNSETEGEQGKTSQESSNQNNNQDPESSGYVESSSTTEGLPLTTALGPIFRSAQVSTRSSLVDGRVVWISVLAVLIGVVASFIARWFVILIDICTNIFFYGKFSIESSSPAGNHLGLWVLVIPIVGALLVGIIARYGSKAIRGHGIPEAMEQVLLNQSRIPPRIAFLKPLSTAISIGSGGPFGAEGPIIATGGAIGSILGQLLKTTAVERKTLLAAGAAAGMAAIFRCPVAAVLLAVELLLFEFRPRSIIPVGLAAVTAAGIQMAFVGSEPIFAMPDLVEPGGVALITYILLGALVGVASVGITKLVYWIEYKFEKLPIHWMWWPALGAIAVGVVGYYEPRTLGVGYDNIKNIISGNILGEALLFLGILKLISWSVSLGSGTSGGTLAPLFTIGGALGAVLGEGVAHLFPGAGIDPRIAALVGMAAMFAGASRALLTSVVFAFETTRQPLGLLPLMGGCTTAYLISCLMMSTTIMTEKIVRRGVRVPSEYSADYLDRFHVGEVASHNIIALDAEDTLAEIRAWLASGVEGTKHQGFPVVEEDGKLIGVVTLRDLLDVTVPLTKLVREVIHRAPIVTYEDNSLRDASDIMVIEGVGRLPVVSKENPEKVIAMITRSDLLSAHKKRLDESHTIARSIDLRIIRFGLKDGD